MLLNDLLSLNYGNATMINEPGTTQARAVHPDRRTAIFWFDAAITFTF